jgi:hypothetical protein
MLAGDTTMSNHHRDIEILLMDYADALRDGTLPTFLKSLSRKEAQLIRRSTEFPEALAVVRLLNEAHFSDRAMHPDIGLFTSRVDAEIAARVKQSQAAPRQKRLRTQSPRS